MKNKPLIVSIVAVACVVCVTCMGFLGYSRATTAEGSDAQAGMVKTPEDIPALSSFTEQPGEEGFISLERMRAQCQELMQEDWLLGVSSNPYDFIRDGINPYYNEIVAMGPAAIPDLKKELAESPSNGCEEYLFAVAIEEIMNTDGKSAFDGDDRPWTGKEYLEFLEDDSK